MSFGFGVGDFIAVLDKAKLYRERFADAPDHFDSLSREIASLTSILEYIGRVEDQLTEDEKEALAAPIRESTKLLGELEKIFNDNTSLEKHEGTSKLASLKPRAVWRRLRMKPEDVQKLRQRITMNVHFLSAIKGFRDSEAIHTTKQVVTSMRDEQTSRQEREILDWLTITDYAPQQRDHLSRRYTGTNQWLLDSDEYKSWVSAKSQTLLCSGMPGAGKTIMASVVVDDLFHRYQDDSDVGIAYVYCNFKDQERQNHYDLLSSITKQLAQSRSPIPDSLKALYNAHQRRKTSRTLQETVDLLQTIASSYKFVFIIIDDLDECEPKSRQALPSEAFRLQERRSTNVLATTRGIPEIIESANFMNTTTLKILASEIDVSRYISSRIPDMQSFVQRRPEVQDEIQKGILCKINGMFLLAKLLIDSLSCKTTLKAIRKALNAASAEDDTYAYFYEEALERIRVQPPAYVRLANQVLSWIVFAKRPLEIHELQHALAVEEEELEIEEDSIPSAEIMISACAGLITLDEQGGIVRLVHQTTQEFFSKRDADLFPNADSGITSTCVRYLCLDQVQRTIRSLVRDIPSWRKPYYFESSALKDLRKSEIPFCEYAILYWGHHASGCDILPNNVVHLLKNREILQNLATVLREFVGGDVPSAGAHLAAWFDLHQVFKNQLLPPDDITFVDRQGRSSLSWAVHQGHYDLIDYVLEDDILKLKKCHQERNINLFQLALFTSIKRRDFGVTRKLIRFASDESLNFKVAIGPSLLDLCIQQRDITTIRLLLEQPGHGISATQNSMFKDGVQIVNLTGFYGTSLAFAAARGLDEVVKLLLDHGANIEALDRAGRSPMLRAFQSGHASTARILLQHGAKFSGQSGDLPAVWPADNQELIIESLIQGGANIDSRNESGMTLLASAAKDGQNSMVVVLLNHKANIEATDNLGRTPLWHALENEQVQILETLLDHDANIEAADNLGRTPLWGALEKNQELMFGKLLERGARTEVVGQNGDTPLLYAAKKHMTSILEMLLSCGAQIEAQDSQGRTPFLCAIDFKHGSALEILIQCRAKIERQDGNAETLNENLRTWLRYAIAAGSIYSVVILAKHGADINCRDDNGMTPIMLAAEAGKELTLETLTELGADLTGYDKFGRTALLIAAGADDRSVLSTDDLEVWDLDFKLSCISIDWAYNAILRTHLVCQQLEDVQDYQGPTPLWWPITSDRTILSKHLSEVVGEVEVLNNNQGWPPLVKSYKYHVVSDAVQQLLEHVSQFSSDGERFVKFRDGVTERVVIYVRSSLDFNGILIDFNGDLRDAWLNIKPGDPIPQLK